MPSDFTENSVRNELIGYLAGRKSLEEFFAWFIPATLGVDEQATEELRELVYGTKLYLAEYSRGHRTENELRDELRSLASWYSLGEKQDPPPTLNTNV